MNGDYQSPDNIIFGTYEANSTMTRAEAMIRVIRQHADENSEGIRPTLKTAVNNTDDISVINPANGKRVSIPISSWIGNSKPNYSWLVPQLSYSGLLIIGQKALIWDTEFHSFGRLIPLSVEGKMDLFLLKNYLAGPSLNQKREHEATGYSSDSEFEKHTKKQQKAESVLPLISQHIPDAITNSSLQYLAQSSVMMMAAQL